MMIELKNLTKSFGRDFTLRIPHAVIERGDRVALIGLNGSGKSTLLRLLAGLLPPDRIGYQPQQPYSFRGTAEYNVRLAPRARDVDAVLEACALRDLANKKMTALSGGEKQRVFLARMLAGDYDLLLLDEPLSAADLQTGRMLSGVLKTACETAGITLLFSTHLPRQAFEIANKILLLDGGSVAEFGAVEEMKQPKSDFGKAFFSLWNV